MQLGITVTKSSKQAKDPIENMNNIRNQLQFKQVKLFNNGIKLDCYAILNNCNSCSYILSKTAETFQCKPSQQIQLSVRGVFSEDKLSSSLVRLSIGQHIATKPIFSLQLVCSIESLSFDAIDANNLNVLTLQSPSTCHFSWSRRQNSSSFAWRRCFLEYCGA